jgi:hypothetical protein
MWFLNDVVVVAASFDDAGVSTVSSAFGPPFIDFGYGFGERFLPVLRGKSPPAL